ncbi:MAG: hypothetical protein H6606_01880 [Flavobacteriales bacterium]|nr:hypothetical protein [Flavobacteriales bacterium]
MRTLITSLMLLLLLRVTIAQVPDQRNIYGFRTGYSLSKVLLDRVFSGDQLKYQYTGGFVHTFQYDRLLNKWLQCGLNYSRQNMSLTFEEYVDNNGILQTGDFSAELRRQMLHLRVLAYVEKNQWKVYTGMRAGLVRFNVDTDIGNKELKFIDRLAGLTLPSGGLLLTGMEFYPHPNIGIAGEFNILAPHVVAIGISVRH